MHLCTLCPGHSAFLLALHHHSVTAWAHQTVLWSFKYSRSLAVTHQAGLFCSCYCSYALCKEQELPCSSQHTALIISMSRGCGAHPCWFISRGCSLRFWLHHWDQIRGLAVCWCCAGWIPAEKGVFRHADLFWGLSSVPSLCHLDCLLWCKSHNVFMSALQRFLNGI